MKLIKACVVIIVSRIMTVLASTEAFFEHKTPQTSQHVLGESPEPSQPDSNFTRMSLSSIGTSDFTTLSHPDFPLHSVRIKKAPKDWCDPSVDKYTGYIDISPARHLWFYFFESRREPESDPVVLWTNGGPGSSSSTALLFELGPCKVKNYNGTETEVNPNSWNEVSNIFFIDQPVGTGFSYAEYGESVSTTEEGAIDIAAFTAIFFDVFDGFKGRSYHLAGESYAGRYLPVYATEIYEQNKRMEAEGKTPINLVSVLMGNGYTSPYHLAPSYYDAMCTPILYDPIVDISRCVRMKTARPRCEKWTKESCFDTFDAISCQAAAMFCQLELGFQPFLETGKNPYDLSRDCEGGYEGGCYFEREKIDNYLADPSILEMLGVEKNHSDVKAGDDVNRRFLSGLDQYRVHTEYYLEGLLDRGIDILLYVGAYDYVCNWVGIERMVKTLAWEDSLEFHKQEWREWYVDGKRNSPAGRVKNSGRLTFLTVNAAGHFVPTDKPVESLNMFTRWLSKEVF